MKERFYSFAGVRFRVCGADEEMYEDDRMLSPFRTEGQEWDHCLNMRIVDELPGPEGQLLFADSGKQVFQDGDTLIRYVGSVEKSLNGAYMRVSRRGDLSQVLVDRKSIWHGLSPRLVLNAMEAEHQIVQHGGFLLHASYIRWKDRAILFTAPSGTGKSTQAELWCRLRGAELINGDRAAVRSGSWVQYTNVPTAWGVPFSGSSGVCENVTLPIAAIVHLSQAPTTSIARLTGLKAFRCLWEGCSVNVWDRQDVAVCTDTVMEVIGNVPVYHLACTPDESAVIALEQVL